MILNDDEKWQGRWYRGTEEQALELENLTLRYSKQRTPECYGMICAYFSQQRVHTGLR